MAELKGLGSFSYLRSAGVPSWVIKDWFTRSSEATNQAAFVQACMSYCRLYGWEDHIRDGSGHTMAPTEVLT